MKEHNTKFLDNLSKTSYRCGVFIVFLGILVMFIHIINQDYTQALVGLLIFITGYGYAKISTKIRNIIKDEQV